MKARAGVVLWACVVAALLAVLLGYAPAAEAERLEVAVAGGASVLEHAGAGEGHLAAAGRANDDEDGVGGDGDDDDDDDDDDEEATAAGAGAVQARRGPAPLAGRLQRLVSLRTTKATSFVQTGSKVTGRRRRRSRRAARRQKRKDRRAARKQKRKDRRAARKQKRKDRRAARKQKRKARKQKRKDKRAARKQKRKDRKQKRKDKRAARKQKRKGRKQKRKDKRAAKRKRRKDRRAARRKKRKDRRAARRERRKNRRKRRKARRNRRKRMREARKKKEAERKKKEAQEAAAAAKKGPEAVKQEADEKAEAEKQRQATMKALIAERKARRQLASDEAAEKNRVIAEQKANTPKVQDKAPADKCVAKGPVSNVCSISGSGNVSPFGGAKIHRVGKIRAALLSKFLTRDRKFAWFVATRHMVHKTKDEIRVQDVAMRCGKDKIRVTMGKKGGDVPRVQINRSPAVRLDSDAAIPLPGAPKDKKASYYVKRLRFTQGKGQNSLVEVEINCGHDLPAATPYASGVRTHAVWTGWESKNPSADLRGMVRVMADARYQNLVKGQCRWGDVEAYTRWPRDPRPESTPEFAGGAEENTECAKGGASDSLDTSVSVSEGDSSSSGAAVGSADAMVECRKEVESCTGITMGKAASWFKRTDADVTKMMDDAIKGCAADKTGGTKVSRPAVCAQVCGIVQDARTAVDAAIKDALQLGLTCEKSQEANTLLERYAIERHELSALCGGKADASLATPPKLPAKCKPAAEEAVAEAKAAAAAAAKASQAPGVVAADDAMAAAGIKPVSTKAILQTLTPGQVAALSPEQARAVEEVTSNKAKTEEADAIALATQPEEESTEELKPAVENYEGLDRGQLMPCDYAKRDETTAKLVPKNFEQDPSNPVDVTKYKEACSAHGASDSK